MGYKDSFVDVYPYLAGVETADTLIYSDGSNASVNAPEGTIAITQNGTVDVAAYASAAVNVSGGGGGASIGEMCFYADTTGGYTFSVQATYFDGFDDSTQEPIQVDCDVTDITPALTLNRKMIKVSAPVGKFITAIITTNANEIVFEDNFVGYIIWAGGEDFAGVPVNYTSNNNGIEYINPAFEFVEPGDTTPPEGCIFQLRMAQT